MPSIASSFIQSRWRPPSGGEILYPLLALRAQSMLIGYVSDEYYAALANVLVELRPRTSDMSTARVVIRSSPSGAIDADVSPGAYELCLARPGFSSKRVEVYLDPTK